MMEDYVNMARSLQVITFLRKRKVEECVLNCVKKHKIDRCWVKSLTEKRL